MSADPRLIELYQKIDSTLTTAITEVSKTLIEVAGEYDLPESDPVLKIRDRLKRARRAWRKETRLSALAAEGNKQ